MSKDDELVPGLAYAEPRCGIRSIRHYMLGEAIGEGTYGKVFKARDRTTHDLVALKKMIRHHESEGFPRTETREIKILKSVRHPNMVNLKEVVTSFGEEAAALGAAGGVNTAAEGAPTSGPENKLGLFDRVGDVFMVFDYVEYDLAGLLTAGYKFTLLQTKAIMLQLLSVMDYLHGKGFTHRDIKCANLLLTERNVLKLGDFGLARAMPPPAFDPTTGAALPPTKLTNQVITLWYRPLELLLGATEYSGAVDMWSCGCILLELLVGKPVFPARTDTEQTKQLIGIFGSPPGSSSLRTLPLWPKIAETLGDKKPRLEDWLKRHPSLQDPELVFLVTRLLEPDPKRRITAREALSARWFTSAPGIDKDDPSAGLPPVSANPTFPKGAALDLHEFTARTKKTTGFGGSDGLELARLQAVDGSGAASSASAGAGAGASAAASIAASGGAGSSNRFGGPASLQARAVLPSGSTTATTGSSGFASHTPGAGISVGGGSGGAGTGRGGSSAPAAASGASGSSAPAASSSGAPPLANAEIARTVQEVLDLPIDDAAARASAITNLRSTIAGMQAHATSVATVPLLLVQFQYHLRQLQDRLAEAEAKDRAAARPSSTSAVAAAAAAHVGSAGSSRTAGGSGAPAADVSRPAKRSRTSGEHTASSAPSFASSARDAVARSSNNSGGAAGASTNAATTADVGRKRGREPEPAGSSSAGAAAAPAAQPPPPKPAGAGWEGRDDPPAPAAGKAGAAADGSAAGGRDQRDRDRPRDRERDRETRDSRDREWERTRSDRDRDRDRDRHRDDEYGYGRPSDRERDRDWDRSGGGSSGGGASGPSYRDWAGSGGHQSGYGGPYGGYGSYEGYGDRGGDRDRDRDWDRDYGHADRRSGGGGGGGGDWGRSSGGGGTGPHGSYGSGPGASGRWEDNRGGRWGDDRAGRWEDRR